MNIHERALETAQYQMKKSSVRGSNLENALQTYLTTLLDSPEMVYVINEAVYAAPSIECAYDVIAAIKKETGCGK